MLRQLKNIDTAFRHIRLFSFLLILACTAISCYSVYACLALVRRDHGKIYVLTNGKLLEATEGNRADNLAVEIRDHVKMFHYYFFSLDPDDAVISRNTTNALYLADGSAEREFRNLKEQGYYAGIISGNVSQRITVDSIALDMNQRPYRFTYYGKLEIIRPTTKAVRSLVTEGDIRETSRSEHNPHGFLIERWRILQNKDLKIDPRRH